MGFGFGLTLIPLVICISILLVLLLVISKEKIFGKIFGFMWLAVFGLAVFSVSMNWLTSKKILEHEDFHGEYIVDRDYFSGFQSDWQYNHFRFKITSEDSLFLYVTENESIIQTYKGIVNTITPHSSARLIVQMEEPVHHILTGNPTIYREPWGFFLVFKSAKFHNMYFRKGQWKPL